MGGCQNCCPFLGTLNIRCRIKIGIQKGTIILTTTHVVIIVIIVTICNSTDTDHTLNRNTAVIWAGATMLQHGLSQIGSRNSQGGERVIGLSELQLQGFGFGRCACGCFSYNDWLYFTKTTAPPPPVAAGVAPGAAGGC